jgi:hypothetical protein
MISQRQLDIYKVEAEEYAASIRDEFMMMLQGGRNNGTTQTENMGGPRQRGPQAAGPQAAASAGRGMESQPGNVGGRANAGPNSAAEQYNRP